MCMEDIRIGRKSTAIEGRLVTNMSVQILCQADPKRTSLIIYPPITGVLYLGTTLNIALLSGIHLSATMEPIRITLATHGQLVTRLWYAVCSVNAAAVSFIETHLEDE